MDHAEPWPPELEIADIIREANISGEYNQDPQGVHQPSGSHPARDIQQLLLEALQRELDHSEHQGGDAAEHIAPDDEWPAFIGRRPHLRNIVRNLIVLDHILIALLFPFSLFNILRALFSELTFSEYDFYIDILQYTRRIPVVGPDGKSLQLCTDSLGLLVKFHNVVVFYTRNFYHAMNVICGNSRYTAYLYTLFVRANAISLYLAYGIMTSSYLCFAAFFFTLCFGMTVIKRYKGVERIVNQIYQTTDGLF